MQFLLRNGEETERLVPEKRFVPWVTVNDLALQEVSLQIAIFFYFYDTPRIIYSFIHDYSFRITEIMHPMSAKLTEAEDPTPVDNTGKSRLEMKHQDHQR